MKLTQQIIYSLGSIQLALTVYLMSNNLELYQIAVIGIAMSVIRYDSFKFMQKHFNKIYSWSMIDSLLTPSSDLSGINLEDYEFRIQQKRELQSIMESKNQIGHVMRVIIVGLLCTFLLNNQFATNPKSSILIILYLIWEANQKTWGSFNFRHLFAMGLVGTFCQFQSFLKIGIFIAYSINFFILLKFYHQFFYEKLASHKNLNSFKINFPFKSFSLFISSFILLLYFFPDQKNPLEQFKEKDKTNKARSSRQIKQMTNQFQQNVNENIKNQSIPLKDLKALQQNNPENKSIKNLIDSQTGILNDKTKSNESKKINQINEEYKNWNKLNKKVLNEILNNKIALPPELIKKFEKISSLEDYSLKLLQNFNQLDNLDLSSEDIESLLKNLPTKNNLSDKEIEQLKNKLFSNYKMQQNQLDKKTLQNLLQKIKTVQNNKTINNNAPKELLSSLEKLMKKAQKKGVNANDIDSLLKDLQKIEDQKEFTPEQRNQLKKLIDASKDVSEKLNQKQPNIPKEEIKFTAKEKTIFNQALLKEKTLVKKKKNERIRHKTSLNQQVLNQNLSNRYDSFKEQENKIQSLQINKEKSSALFTLLKKAFLILLVCFVIYIFQMFIKKDKIIHDEEIEELDPQLKKEINQLIQQAPNRFSSIEDEIIQCYQFFHEIMNKIYYAPDNNYYSPPPTLLKKKGSLLSKRLKDVASSLSSLYVPLKYGNAESVNLTKSGLKEFRSQIKVFLRLSAKLVK